MCHCDCEKLYFVKITEELKIDQITLSWAVVLFNKYESSNSGRSSCFTTHGCYALCSKTQMHKPLGKSQ